MAEKTEKKQEKMVSVEWANGFKTVLKEGIANIFADRGKLRILKEAKAPDVKQAPSEDKRESKDSKESKK